MTEREMSLIEREMSTPEGRRELAAAAGIADAADLLLECFEASGLTQERLAQLLGLTPGRVSQVLHGDGNVKVATLARFLSAMGRELQLGAQLPTDDSEEQPCYAPVSSSLKGEWSDVLNVRQTVNVSTVSRGPVDEGWAGHRRVELRANYR
jgi:transcriptional regulator with XRE-family HTH domain